MKRFLRFLLLLLLLLIGVGWFNTIRFSSRQLQVEPVSLPNLSSAMPEILAAAIRCPTVSATGSVDTAAFLQLDTILRRDFPLAHERLNFRAVNQFGRVYHWPGTDSKLEPILLLAHLDVVPADNPDDWTYPPFGGRIAEGNIWGRGSLDDKLSAVGLLAAVEQLLTENFQPERGLYLAFGQDEETSGKTGAASIAEIFRQEGISFAFILDEGLVILEDALAGLHSPLAMIGIAEKGICTLTISVANEGGGHASMPPDQTAVGILASAIDRLQANPFPARLDGAVRNFFDYVGPEMEGINKVVVANRWLTSRLLQRQLAGDPASNALIRTTVAPTMLRAGVRSNVLPTRAAAKVNIRILPGETVESVLAYCREVIDDDRVIVELDQDVSSNDPSPVSPVDAYGFRLIERTTREVFPEAVVAPSLVVSYTDSRNYLDLSEQVYRFCPVQITRDDLKRIHGTDERLSVDSYQRLIGFYYRLISQGCGD